MKAARAQSYLGPNCVLDLPGVLEALVGYLHFAGMEISNVWRGYMEVVVRSGKRVVGEVIEALAVRGVARP